MHIGIIPDGNRRWCKQEGKTETDLVLKHINLILDMISSMQSTEINCNEISCYILSSDNLKRSDNTIKIICMFLQNVLLLRSLLKVKQRAKIARAKEGIDESITYLNVFMPNVTEEKTILFYDNLTNRYSEMIYDLPREISDMINIIKAYETKVFSTIYISIKESECENYYIEFETNSLPQNIFDLNDFNINFIGEYQSVPVINNLVNEISKLSPYNPEAFNINLALVYDPIEDSRRILSNPIRIGRNPIDLVIRTSGEMRSSGFFPLQTLYSEWVYIKKLFPEITKDDILKGIKKYQKRNRRFGF